MTRLFDASLFDSVLIANRGEIAVRVIRTLDRLGIRSIAVHSDADAHAPHVRLADTAVRIGASDARSSYLSIPAIIDAALATGAQAIHPGYGFLAENADFARACEAAGIVFIGPRPDAIETMGDKIRARAAVEARGVATVPGIARPGLGDDELITGAADIGYPVLIKPSAGGGGKGMHLVHDPADLPDALERARREAAASFGDDALFIERFVTNPRHIEVQVLADEDGATVHLGERECSLQRRHQKVIEEAPSPLLSDEQRARMGAAAVETAKAVGYRGAGTVEFIVSADRPDEPFFMEMNTRLQVEHPVTEMVTGIDLVEQQLRIAAGEPLSLAQGDITLTGHAVEARVYAEDPAAGFLPTGGRVLRWVPPTGDGVRVDAAVDDGLEISSDYDPMIAKVIVHAPTRDEALRSLDRALGSTHVLGVGTNTTFLRQLLRHDDVRAGRLDTGLIERDQEALTTSQATDDAHDPQLLGALAVWLEQWHGVEQRHGVEQWHGVEVAASPWRVPNGWRIGAPRATEVRFDEQIVRILGTPAHAQIWVGDEPTHDVRASLDGDVLAATIDGVDVRAVVVRARDAQAGDAIWVGSDAGDTELRLATRARRSAETTDAGLASPMPGTVVSVSVADGDLVEAGAAIVAVEAMKMEHVLRATTAGIVRVQVRAGEQVARGQVLATIEPHAAEHELSEHGESEEAA